VLKASSRCEVWQQQGSRLSAVAQNSALLPGLEQTECRAGPRTTACSVKLPGVKASRGHFAMLPEHIGRARSRQQDLCLEVRGAVRQGQKGGKYKRMHLSDTQTTLLLLLLLLMPFTVYMV